ncbi:NAD(P)H dehydrogenase [Ralstonia sp. A12]|uniref:glutathione-regulated potassium-efflux system oxidoreductase KefF n=1 Tax=Ralstonia sp. A12 TaxID=1217052 RepID=UPI000574E27C|nr:NAD(P)H-dependent oxidoreductase [Ralstonia sp. A12]KHK51859.1 NAD(P)H dehydrogenase [Ralstonia sp. A12]
MTPSRILVIYAHPAPRRSRANKPLARALASLPGVAMHDLYWHYPDFDIDVRIEQEAVEAAELIVFQFPVQWYATPSLLKEWLDVVLEMGWAYGPGGTALRGKHLMVLATTGGRAHSYSPAGTHGYTFDMFLLPLQRTAALCGMQWQPPHVLHDADDASPETIDAHVAEVRAALQPWLPDSTDDSDFPV